VRTPQSGRAGKATGRAAGDRPAHAAGPHRTAGTRTVVPRWSFPGRPPADSDSVLGPNGG
jgi:hypothetical protein